MQIHSQINYSLFFGTFPKANQIFFLVNSLFSFNFLNLRYKSVVVRFANLDVSCPTDIVSKSSAEVKVV